MNNKPYISIVALWGICGLGAVLYNDQALTQLVGVLCIIVATAYYTSGAPSFAIMLVGWLKVLYTDLNKQRKTFIKELKEK